MKNISRYNIAIGLAIIFHCIGFFGLKYFDAGLIARTTPFHLLLMCGLIFYTHKRISVHFLLFFLLCSIGGLVAEMAGVNTGILFGDYAYGNVLGPKLNNVPLIIGINWFIIIYCCAVTVRMFLEYLTARLGADAIVEKTRLKVLSLIVDGAILAVIFDVVLEPAAIKLGYWNWADADVPWQNYFSWFCVSAFFLSLFHVFNINSQNKFAVHLLMIQMIFLLCVEIFI